MPNFVLVNGPPRCGKDTLVSGLVPYFDFMHIKVSAPLKRMLATMLHTDIRWIEENKDTKLKALNGITVRQALIDMSEKYMKPLYGEDIMGKLAWEEARASAYRMVLTSDSGFATEANRIVYNAGRQNCIAIRVHRTGCTFDGDSRHYLPNGICRTYDLHNDSGRQQFIMLGLRAITRHFNVKLNREPDWVKL